MTPEQVKAKEYAEILLAFSRGESVQVNSVSNRWCEVAEPSWNFGDAKYRIAPKPVERWCVICTGDGEFIRHWGQSKLTAERLAEGETGARVALMREVTE